MPRPVRWPRQPWPFVLLLLAPASLAAADKPAPDAALEFFEKRVRPVLAENCYRCHSAQAKKVKGGLLLDSRDGVLKGGDNGTAVVPGHPEKSRLIEAVRYTDVDLRMPPRGKLPAAAIQALTTWVQIGAPWPHEAGAPGQTTAATFDLRKRKRDHWAWQPIAPVKPPPVRHLDWRRTPIDQFILARLEDKGLAPASPADRRTLIRRLSFDLLGLPPTPGQVEAFVRDDSPDAFEKLVDRLLASPHFGERWARHWLDLVRYGESRGHEYDYLAPNAYQYRDYVIRALNADVPYDRFVVEHIAGDLIDRPRLDPAQGFNESVLGTGFWFLGEEVHSPVDIRQDQADRFDNRIDVMTKTFLGLTVGCARCHDHKFDAISTRDYYALFGFLESSTYRLARFDSMVHNRRVAEQLGELRARSRRQVQRALADELRPGVERMGDYLTAAREALLLGLEFTAAIDPARPAAPPFSPDVAGRAKLDEIARSRKLDTSRLAHWVAAVQAAAKDETDPLHPWAKIALDASAREPRNLARLLQPYAEKARTFERDNIAIPKGADVIVDYGHPRPGDWLPDGVAFGPGPVRPGDVAFAVEPTRPIVKFADRAAAENDPTWNVLRPASGAENDPGALGGLVRAGRTIRTPTFTVAGNVWYLVRGAALVYAAVDAHLVIAGPLHGQLVRSVQAGDRFQWLAHDLTAYKGQRCHLEFTPRDGSDFALALVVQSASPPPPPDTSNRVLFRRVGGAESLDATAAGYQKLFSDVLDRIALDHILGSPDADEYARLANWMVKRRELFAAAETDVQVAEPVRSFLAEQARLVAQIRPDSRLAMAILDGPGVDEHVFIRGSHKAPGPVVPRRFLEALAGPDPLHIPVGSGRLELARQMTDPAVNPFIARVMVNRVWQHLFGRGIVASVDNFGALGEAPTHPELLDYLADRFVKEGWSVKKLIRTLVLSNTYRMSSRPPAGDVAARVAQVDPQNLLLHHMRIRRLEGEAIRDALLSVSGRLNDRLLGPSVPVFLTEFQEGRGRPAGGPLDGNGRRSIYLGVRRNFLSSFLLAFDTPIPFSTVGRRSVSNVPAQALILMNDPFVHQQASLWARRVLAGSGSAGDRVTAMYLCAFGRPPSDRELGQCLDFLDRQKRLEPHNTPGDELTVWTDLAHVLLNVKEFIFLN